MHSDPTQMAQNVTIAKAVAIGRAIALSHERTSEAVVEEVAVVVVVMAAIEKARTSLHGGRVARQ